jgi:predicted CXXCH cytochrome family protein
MRQNASPRRLFALLGAALFALACTDEKIVFRDREPFNPPPDEAQGMLGYFDDAEKMTTCGNCHVGQQGEWVETRHADAYATLAALPDAQEFCFNCHTTNDQGNLVEGDAGWKAVHDTIYHDVQCEACHGPGLDHVINPDATQPLASIRAGVDINGGCGECHNGAHHPFVEEWEQSGHAQPLAQPASRAECVECHTGQGALRAWGVFDEYVEQDAPLGEHLGITCAVCHDPHDGRFEGQLRYAIDVPSEEQNLCMKCHHKRAEPETEAATIRGPHSPEGPLLLGEGAGWFPPGFEPEIELIRGTHGSERNPRLCATCHVAQYEVTDQLTGEFVFNSVGHLFLAIPCLDSEGKPSTAQDCALEQRTFQACTATGCHGDETAARTAFVTARDRIADLVVEAEALLALPAVAADNNLGDGVFTVADGVWFNTQLAKLEGTSTHNPFLAENLMVASIEALQDTYGVAALRTGVSLERQIR